MSFVTTNEVVLGAQVANAGTLVIPYPAGTNQAFFTGANAAADGAVTLNDNERIPELPSGVRVNIVYGAGDITITNNSGYAWPVGTRVRAQLGRVGANRPKLEPSPAITPLTDSSGGTAGTTIAAIGATYTQAEVRNAVASLAAQIERLRVTLQSEGIIR